MMIGVAVLIGIVGLFGCHSWERDHRTPTMPGTEGVIAINYAQMEDGSTVVDGQQINWMVSEYGSIPYEHWMYIEVNQQNAIGQPPGTHQVPVALGKVIVHFHDLPGDATQILIGVKTVRDDTDQTFTERGRFAVVNGSVSIPLDDADLVYYFGATHYSVWFQALGGKNAQGSTCGQIALSGVMPGGQPVNLSKRLCFGTNPPPAPITSSSPVVASGNAAPVASGAHISGTWEEGDLLTGNYTYTDANNDPEGASVFQWYRADDANGVNASAIAGATAQTYTTQAADAGKFLRFEVIPVAQSGTSPGSAAVSAWNGQITSFDSCMVTTEADSGAGSLRQVLANNPCCGLIRFASGVNTITLAGTQLEIPGTCANLTIDGGSGVTISGNNASRVLWVNSGASVTFRGLWIRDGNVSDPGSGGGIRNYGTLTIDATTTVSNNRASSGGGMYNDSGTMTVSGTIRNNTASYAGAGMYNQSGMATVSGTISGNTAARGGGMYNHSGTMTVSGTISDNTASYFGGGIHTSGGTMTVTGTVIGNTATMHGGGIYTSGGTMTVNGTVSGNTAAEHGGGISLFKGIVTVSGAVSGNKAQDGGGMYNYSGTMTISGAVRENVATDQGGGIYNYAFDTTATVTLDSSARVLNNQATNAGGGIYNQDEVETITVNGATSTTVNSNTAATCRNYYDDDDGCLLP